MISRTGVGTKECLVITFLESFFLAQSTHTHTLQWNAICQQIRGRDAGVIETAFTVNIQENMSAGEGRAAMVSQACEREAGYTLHH